MKYVAFISYRHTDAGRRHAERLESALKQYAKPFWKPPIAIFRDDRVVRPGEDLPRVIRDGLHESQFLLYLASRDAADSPWIRDELRIWCEELRRADRLIIVHVADRIVADHGTGRIVWEQSDALPDVLRPHVASIPVWVDLSWATTDELRDLANPEYKKRINAITAALRNKDPGEMNDEQVLVHRRNVRVQRGAVATIVALGAAALWSAAQARADRDAAQRSETHASAAADTARAQKDSAERQRRIADARRREADSARGVAVERTHEAFTQRAEAQRQRDSARARKRQADEQRDIAEERRRLAEARLLAAHAEELFQKGTTFETTAGLLPVGLALAVESQRTYPTWEGDRALRAYLSVMPRLIAVVPGKGELRFLPGRDLLLVTDGQAVRALDASDGSVRYRHSLRGASLSALSRDGDYAAVVFAEADSVAVIRPASGEELFRLPCESEHAFFSARGDLVAFTCWHVTHVRHLPDGAVVADIPQSDDYPNVALAGFSNDGRYLTLGDHDAGWIRRWDLAPPAHELTTDGPLWGGKALSPDGRFWVREESRPTPRTMLLDLSSDARKPKEWLPLPTPVSVSFTQDGRRAVFSSGGRIEVWNLAERQRVDSVPQGVTQASDLDDARPVRGAASTNSVRVRRVDGEHDVTFIVLPLFRRGSSAIWQPISFGGYDLSADGRYVATSGPEDVIRLWEAEANPDTARTESLIARGLALAPSGDAWAAGSGRLLHLSLPSGQVTKVVSGPLFERLAMSDDGSRLVAGGRVDRGVESVPGFWVLDGRTRTRIAERLSAGEIMDVAFVPDSRVVAVLTSRGLLFYDTSDSTRLRELPYERYLAKLDPEVFRESALKNGGMQREIERIAFSRDGRYLLLIGTSSVIATEFPGGSIVLREAVELPVAAFGTGDTVAVAVGDSVRLRGLRSGTDTPVAVIPDFSIRDVAFTADGKYLAIAAGDGTVRVWDIAARREVSRIESHYGILRVAFSSHRDWLITASNGIVQVWPWKPDELLEMARSRVPFAVGSRVVDEYRTPELSRRPTPARRTRAGTPRT